MSYSRRKQLWILIPVISLFILILYNLIYNLLPPTTTIHGSVSGAKPTRSHQMSGVPVTIVRGAVSGAYDPKGPIFEFYSPSTQYVKQGESVTWTNQNTQNHTVTSIMAYGKSTLFDSGIKQPGDSFTYTFSELGMFDYYCHIHPFMSGKVVVSNKTS